MQLPCKCRFSLLTVFEVDTVFPSCLANCALEYPGAVYHVVNRGDRREEFFRDDPDRERVLSTLIEACDKIEWQKAINGRCGWRLVAARDDDEFEMDRGTTGDGQLDECVQPSGGWESEDRDQLYKVRTDT
jgi:hypothetical protein